MSQQAILDALSVLDEEHAIGVIEHRRVTIRSRSRFLAAAPSLNASPVGATPKQSAGTDDRTGVAGFSASWIRDRRPTLGRHVRSML